MSKNTDTYRTPDLKIATFLRIKGFRLITVERKSNGRGVFVFTDNPDREELILSFVNREQKLEVLSFLDELRSLKALCRN